MDLESKPGALAWFLWHAVCGALFRGGVSAFSRYQATNMYVDRKATMSSLDNHVLRPFTYVLECVPRQGTDYPSIYVGTSSNVNLRISQHAVGAGSCFRSAVSTGKCTASGTCCTYEDLTRGGAYTVQYGTEYGTKFCSKTCGAIKHQTSNMKRPNRTAKGKLNPATFHSLPPQSFHFVVTPYDKQYMYRYGTRERTREMLKYCNVQAYRATVLGGPVHTGFSPLYSNA